MRIFLRSDGVLGLVGVFFSSWSFGLEGVDTAEAVLFLDFRRDVEAGRRLLK